MTNYWIIGTGRERERDLLWEDFLSKSRIRINFDIEDDLSSFVTQGERALKGYINSERPDKPRAPDQCWGFAAEMAVGDKVIARKGIHKIVGFGEVISPYSFDQNLGHHMHVRDVNWEWVGEINWEGPRLQRDAVVKLQEHHRPYTLLVELARSSSKSPDSRNTSQPQELRQFWWVNQNQTYKHEIRGGYLWSPKTNVNGDRNQFYDNMAEVMPGDVVFSFCDAQIKAIGVATGTAETVSKPTEFGERGSYWRDEGWFIPVEFKELENSLRPKEHISVLRPTLPPKYSPLQDNGNGNQNVYLASVPKDMAAVLIELLAGQVEAVTKNFSTARNDAANEEVERNIKDRNDIDETEKIQLIKARRGQGLFRSRVELIETACRLTGVRSKEHLRASHIKPWRASENHEKLDGNNGLLLAPHVDHLFDRGFISFDDDGSLLLATKLDPDIIRRWGLSNAMEGQNFNPEQRNYLAYHRDHIFGGQGP